MKYLCKQLLAALLACTLPMACLAEAGPDAAEPDTETTELVKLSTDLGEILVELYPQAAPITVANFLAYVDQYFYDGTIFHRVVPGFVVQGGGMTFDFAEKKTHAAIKNESDNGLSNDYMTLSMARTSAPDSATSQFFINLRPNTSLDARGNRPGYAVFGKVIAGQSVVEGIARQPRGLHRGHPEAPNEAVRILTARRVEPTAPTSASDPKNDTDAGKEAP